MKALGDMPIGFPGLFGGFELNPDPVALHIGHGIYWYGIILALGLLAGLYLCMKQAKRFGLTEDNVLDLALWATPLCIIGSRIYYVVFYLDLYRRADGSLDWLRMLAVWDGGIAMYGTVIMGVLVAWVYCRIKKLKFAAMVDLGVMGLFVGQSIGRWGNFMNREAFGAATTLPWRMQLWVSPYQTIEVHPTFFYESLWNLIGLLLVLFIVSRARRFDGEVGCFYFLWYGIGRSWIEGLRTDSLYLFDWTLFDQPIRVSQALSVVLALCAAAALFYNLVIRKRDGSDLWVLQVERAASAGDGSGAALSEPAREAAASQEHDSGVENLWEEADSAPAATSDPGEAGCEAGMDALEEGPVPMDTAEKEQSAAPSLEGETPGGKN